MTSRGGFTAADVGEAAAFFAGRIGDADAGGAVDERGSEEKELGDEHHEDSEYQKMIARLV